MSFYVCFKKRILPKKEKDCKIKKYNLINMKMQSQVHIFRCCYLFDYSCKIIQKYEDSDKSDCTCIRKRSTNNFMAPTRVLELL